MGRSPSFLTGLSRVSLDDRFFSFSSERPPVAGIGGVSGEVLNLLLRKEFEDRSSNFVLTTEPGAVSSHLKS